MVLLPRRVNHSYRFARFFYRTSWRAWRSFVTTVAAPGMRATLLSLFGPLALLVLYSSWATGLILAFGCLQWSLQTPLTIGGAALPFTPYLYFSGVTFFTLGYGDLTPIGELGRFLAVAETGLGFGFLAMIICYHPVLTQAFSNREIVISLLDARGGSSPTAAQILIRSRNSHQSSSLSSDMAAWETWSAKLLESGISYPMLAYYRSQHDNQSWLATLTSLRPTRLACEPHSPLPSLRGHLLAADPASDRRSIAKPLPSGKRRRFPNRWLGSSQAALANPNTHQDR